MREYDLTDCDLDGNREEPDRACERCGDAPCAPDSDICPNCDDEEE